jgi:hypothetical protein
MRPVAFSPGADFYAAAAQVIPLLLLALLFEARLVSRLAAALPRVSRQSHEAHIEGLAEGFFRGNKGTGAVPPRTDREAWAEAYAFARGFYEETLAMMGETLESERAGGRRGRWTVRTVLGGVLVALVAEGLALSALALDEPPDAIAGLVLVGCGLLLLALLATLADFILDEFRAEAAPRSDVGDTSAAP